MLLKDLRDEAAKLARSIHDEVVQVLLSHLIEIIKYTNSKVELEVLLDSLMTDRCTYWHIVNKHEYMPDIVLLCKYGSSLASVILMEIALTLRRVADVIPRLKRVSQLLSEKLRTKIIPIVIYVYDRESVKGVFFDKIKQYVLDAKQDISRLEEPIILITSLDRTDIENCAKKIAEIITATVNS